MMKQAVVVVSFGTLVPEAMRAIDSIEQAVTARCRQQIYRAFTSGFIRKKLRQRDGVDIPDPRTLFARLTEQGFDEIFCVCTHVIPGIEYERLCADAAAFPQVHVAKPLLWEQADYTTCVHAVMDSIPPRADDEALVLMGHGTAHFANAAYCELEHKFRTAGYAGVYVGTVDGYPTLDTILPQLRADGYRRVMLMPFMIVAGDHARNDLSGDDCDSWKSRLEALGYETRTVLKGLGEIPAIAQQLASHLEQR
ncbi:MAG: sirohydrochlorin cobaltochelatase [Clostridiales bacterium]|nr:sirohydrochlorin cobaltochelatase [Clostridiales bacterium]